MRPPPISDQEAFEPPRDQLQSTCPSKGRRVGASCWQTFAISKRTNAGTFAAMKRDRDPSEFGDMIGCHTDHRDSQPRMCDGGGMKGPVAPCAQPGVPLSLLELYAPLSPIASQRLGDSQAIGLKGRPAAFEKQRKHRPLPLTISREVYSAEPARGQRSSPSGAPGDCRSAS